MTTPPLADLHVLDLTHFIAGPYSTKLLGGLGADVIKIERPGIGDGLRTVGPFVNDEPHPDRGCPFLYLNTDKRGITLNLKSDQGLQIADQLLNWADVLVENFRPGVMESLGLSYKSLEKRYPKLVVVSVSNFGQTGPYRDLPMTDITAQAFGGLMNEMGEPDRAPLKLGGYQALYAAGVAAFTGITIALMARELRGVGQHVDVSILEMQTHTEWHASVQYSYTGQERRRLGRWNNWKILKGADGYMGLVYNDRSWPALRQLVGGVLDDPRFDTLEGRTQYTLEVGAAVGEWLSSRSVRETYHAGQKLGIPWGYVASMADVVESPQYQVRSFVGELDHPVAGSAMYPGVPFTMGGYPSVPRRPAPQLGQHNAEIYGDMLGYDRSELIRLREAGVI